MLSCGGGLKTCLLNHLLMSPIYTDHPTIYIANSLFQAGYMANLLMSLVSLDQLANMTWVLYISLYLDLRDMLCRHANSRMSPIYLLSRAVVQVWKHVGSGGGGCAGGEERMWAVGVGRGR